MSDFHTPEQLARYFAKRGGYKTLAEREDGWSEDMLCNNISDYLKQNHPDVPFQFDMSGYNLSITAAQKAKRQRSEGFKVPDLIIYIKKGKFGFFALEIKKKSVKLFKKDGNFVADKHLNAQRVSILRLRKYGQCADFGIGYVDSIKKINDYLDKGEIEYTLK
jgi:hypothetical protein